MMMENVKKIGKFVVETLYLFNFLEEYFIVDGIFFQLYFK
jgi:hypothetical protein